MKNRLVNFVAHIPEWVIVFVKEHLGKVSAHTLGWIGIILLHFASVPTLLAVLWGQSDKLPPLDLMIFIWTALITLFFRALIERNSLYIATICLGFAAQSFLMSLILFK